MARKNALTCRQAVRLLLEDEDHEITAGDAAAVQAHVRICFMCVRFVGQLDFMRRATRAWRAYSERVPD
jgi:hypothetical protein